MENRSRTRCTLRPGRPEGDGAIFANGRHPARHAFGQGLARTFMVELREGMGREECEEWAGNQPFESSLHLSVVEDKIFPQNSLIYPYQSLPTNVEIA